MNEMIKVLTNKIPYKIGPWKNIESWKSNYHPDPTYLVTELPEDIDFVESYVFDCNRFIHPGKTGYVRMQNFYTEATNEAEIQAVVAQFKKTRERFFEISHSNSISHVHIGTLTDSVKSMSSFQDLKNQETIQTFRIRTLVNTSEK